MESFPALGFEHAAASVRTGSRFVGWVGRRGLFFPTSAAVFCWLAYYGLAQLAATWAATAPIVRSSQTVCEGTGIGIHCALGDAGTGVGPVITNTFDWRPIGGVAAAAALAFLAGAMFTTVGALTVGVLKVLCGEPASGGRVAGAHAGGPGGSSGAGGRRAGGAGRSRGPLAAVAGVKADWKAAKRDATKVNKRLDRVGSFTAKRWGRRWAAEHRAGHDYSEPGSIARRLMRRVDPSEAAKKAAKQDAKERARAERQLAKDRARELAAQTAEIHDRRSAENGQNARLDPTDGPPPAPANGHRPAERAPEVAGWERRSTKVDADVQAFLRDMSREQGPPHLDPTDGPPAAPAPASAAPQNGDRP
jgi:hypothetical protein